MSGMHAHAQEPPFPTDGRGNPRVEHLGASVDQMIYEFMEAERIPGMTLAIVQAPYITRLVSYGLTDIAEKCLHPRRPSGPLDRSHRHMQPLQ